MVTKRVFQSLSAITLGRHKMNDPRYEFLTEEKNGEVVSCIVNNAEIKDVPGIDYELSINPDNPDKIDALQIIINDESKKLGDVFMQLPYGVIKKNVPGIGATTLALRSPNNCIVVCPTKALAYEKYLTGIDPQTGRNPYLYVGGGFGDIKQSPSSKAINKYLSNKTIRYKKILVVADSLRKVMEKIEPRLRDWYIMVDEIDSYQADSTYRNRALGWVMDYFFKFPERQRCLVSATMRPFSNPEILKMPVIEVNFRRLIKRKVKLLYTNDVHLTTAQTIIRLRDMYGSGHKIAVAYNRISAIRAVINLLPEELRAECAILCSAQSQSEAGAYYANLEGTCLPKPITFITCTYFVGVDIDERFHLLSVSDIKQIYTILSPEKMLQIAGRCRHPQGLYDETIIYNSSSKLNERYTVYNKNKLLCLADELCNMYNATVKIYENFNGVLTYSFLSSMQSLIRQSKQTFYGSTPVSLIRKSIHGNYVISYFNIDALVEFVRLREAIYLIPDGLVEALGKTCRIVDWKKMWHENGEATQKVVAATNKDLKELQYQSVDEVVEAIREMHEQRTDCIPVSMENLKRKCNRTQRGFVERYEKLSQYVPFENLVQRLSDMRDKSNAWYKWYHNAVIFNALAENHPFKQVIKASFKPETKWCSLDIQEHLNVIFEQMGMKPVKEEREAVKWLKCLCTLQRNKDAVKGNYYIVKNYCSEKYLNCEIAQTISMATPINEEFKL